MSDLPETDEERHERVDANIQVLWDQFNAIARLLVEKGLVTPEELRASLARMQSLQDAREAERVKRLQWENPDAPKQ